MNHRISAQSGTRSHHFLRLLYCIEYKYAFHPILSHFPNCVVVLMTTPTKNPGLMKKSRDQNLDATRGIAAIMIFLYHISIFEWTRFLWIYVNLFFLLSGYVLYDQIISIKKIKELKIFLKARFMRIFPLFIFILFFRIILDIINRVNNQLPVSSFFEIFENKDIFYAILLLQNFSQKSTMLFSLRGVSLLSG